MTSVGLLYEKGVVPPKTSVPERSLVRLYVASLPAVWMSLVIVEALPLSTPMVAAVFRISVPLKAWRC